MTAHRIPHFFIATMATAALLISACSSAPATSAAQPTTAAPKSAAAQPATTTAPAAPAAATSTTAAAPATARRIDIELSDDGIKPANIDTKVGEKVILVAKNIGTETHNMVALTGATFVSPDIEPGKTIEVPWTAPATAQTVKVVCAYHSTLTYTITVK